MQIAGFVAEFERRWPKESLIAEGQQRDCAYVTLGGSRFAIELRDIPVPEGVTGAVLAEAIRYWPTAGQELASHSAHLAVATTVQRGKPLVSASALTKIIVALLSVTDSIGICWLNGPVLHSAQTFISLATSVLPAGLLPVMLWVAVHWKPEEHMIHTKGMLQFEAPEIFVAQQADAFPELVEYMLDIAHYVLASGKEILDGETVDGPKGTLLVTSIDGSDPNKKGLILVPVRSN